LAALSRIEDDNLAQNASPELKALSEHLTTAHSARENTSGESPKPSMSMRLRNTGWRKSPLKVSLPSIPTSWLEM
jgi:hypothetical protein